MGMKTPGWVLKKKEATVGVLHKILGGRIFMRGVNIRTTWAACPALPTGPAPWPALPHCPGHRSAPLLLPAMALEVPDAT